MSKWTDGEREESFWLAVCDSPPGMLLTIALFILLYWLLGYLPA
jgi:hypothetical protein